MIKFIVKEMVIIMCFSKKGGNYIKGKLCKYNM